MDAIPKDLLDKLACPKCRGPLESMPERAGLACATCDLLYEVHDGIPALIEELAKPLSGRVR